MAHAVGSVRYLGWEQRLEGYAQSQLTVNEFCEWEGVSPATFCHWRKKLATGNVAKRVTNRVPSGTSKCDELRSTLDCVLWCFCVVAASVPRHPGTSVPGSPCVTCVRWW